ncbi:hypothetical protein K503DRAFT_805836 [Rhizopogon vinicolor AM-OR11-026]|uniref:RRM domain-containing protein n=1 Tax=Rhizopogon vinicolor AM-OR11-026 TaxID=1314800 RepID=A0A1B7MGJ5_9AGAM|nr:hypothetical protein K503DRAFT_805836 [Rhizopogon vinicolor AM-OR11-026]
MVEGAKDAPVPRPNKRKCLSDHTADPGPSSRPPVHKTEKSGTTSFDKGPLWANEAKESHPVLSPTDPPETNTIPEGLDDNEAILNLEWMRRCMKSASDVSPDKDSVYKALNKKLFQGRLLYIIPAVDRKGKFEVEDGEGKKKSLKDERNSRRKATAGREFNWSTSYMNGDAVASSIADRMGIAKADILNPESDDAAGVVLSSFSSRARSDTAILIKNIPYETSTEQIREMFEVHGELSRVVVPPAGTMTVLEFVHADEAAKAFRAVAYRRLGNSVIYRNIPPFHSYLPFQFLSLIKPFLSSHSSIHNATVFKTINNSHLFSLFCQIQCHSLPLPPSPVVN